MTRKNKLKLLFIGVVIFIIGIQWVFFSEIARLQAVERADKITVQRADNSMLYLSVEEAVLIYEQLNDALTVAVYADSTGHRILWARTLGLIVDNVEHYAPRRYDLLLIRGHKASNSADHTVIEYYENGVVGRYTIKVPYDRFRQLLHPKE